MSSERTTRVTRAELQRLKDETDDVRLDAMTDEDIARQVAEDPSLPPLDIDWDQASLVIPAACKDVITLRVDHDVLEWLRSTGPGYQTRINKALRTWYEQAAKRKQAVDAGIGVRKAGKPKAHVSALGKAMLKKAVKKAARPAPARKHA